MTATVIDTSVALLWVLPEQEAEWADRYIKAEDVLSPDILLVEAANVLAKKVRARDISGPDAER